MTRSLCVLVLALAGCPDDPQTPDGSVDGASDVNPCVTEQTFTMAPADGGIALVYCSPEEFRACGILQTTPCELPAMLTFGRTEEGSYEVLGRNLVVLNPSAGTPSGQSFPSVSDVPEDTRLTADLRLATPIPGEDDLGTLEVTFSGETVTIHTLVDPHLPVE